MNSTRRSSLGSSLATVAPLSRARAQTLIKIGVLNDQLGPYRDNIGAGSVACEKQAIDEFVGGQSKHGGFKVELISADQQNPLSEGGCSLVRS